MARAVYIKTAMATGNYLSQLRGQPGHDFFGFVMDIGCAH